MDLSGGNNATTIARTRQDIDSWTVRSIFSPNDKLAPVPSSLPWQVIADTHHTHDPETSHLSLDSGEMPIALRVASSWQQTGPVDNSPLQTLGGKSQKQSPPHHNHWRLAWEMPTILVFSAMWETSKSTSFSHQKGPSEMSITRAKIPPDDENPSQDQVYRTTSVYNTSPSEYTCSW